MRQSSQHIIQQLKLQPKQGKDISTSADSAKNSLEALIRTLASEGQSISEPFKKITSAMLDLQDSTTNNLAGFGKLLGSVQRLNKGFLENIDSITKLFQRNNELIKTYGITEKAAQDYGYQLDELSKDMGYGREETENYIKQLGGLTGGFISAKDSAGYLNKSLINQQRYLTDIIGVSDAAAESIMEMNAGIAARSKNTVDAQDLENQLINRAREAQAIEQITGLKGVQRTIDEEIAKAGSETSLQYSKYPKQLSIAVMKAKTLGLSMEQLAKTGDELLNIESSIGNELEYQLLSGKRLIGSQEASAELRGKSLTNAYRQATLQGDMNKQANIMKEIMDSQGDVLENNMLARKQLAKTLGVEESTMAKMVQKRKLLKSMGAENLFNLTGEALEKKLNEMGAAPQQIADIMEQDDTRTTQERMAESLRKIETQGILIKYSKDNFTKAYDDAKDVINKSRDSYTAAMTADKGLLKLYDASSAAVGSFQIVNKAITTTTTELTKLGNAIPILGAQFNTISSALTEALENITGTQLDDMTINQVGQVNLGQQGGQNNDAVMVNDGFVQFNPRDKFTRVNDGMTVAGTNVGGIDRFAAQMEKRDSRFESTMTRLLSTWAAEMKKAIETANLKVEIDKTFASTNLNRGRYV